MTYVFFTCFSSRTLQLVTLSKKHVTAKDLQMVAHQQEKFQ